ncbi:MAG: SOS response-associated peptidase [Halobacteriales archaeon]
MCGRISLAVPQSVLETRFDATATQPIHSRYNIAPGDDLAVVPNETSDSITFFEWGLLPNWVDEPADFPMPINARAETITEKPTFREAFERRRCLVLADGFYEWGGDRGSKRPYRITLADGDPFAMAGLWERWQPPTNGNAEHATRTTVTVVTTDANDLVGEIHDRMPVILDPTEESQWLEATDPAARTALLDPYPADGLELSAVSTAVNDPTNDDPSILETQPGLDEFS